MSWTPQDIMPQPSYIVNQSQSSTPRSRCSRPKPSIGWRFDGSITPQQMRHGSYTSKCWRNIHIYYLMYVLTLILHLGTKHLKGGSDVRPHPLWTCSEPSRPALLGVDQIQKDFRKITGSWILPWPQNSSVPGRPALLDVNWIQRIFKGSTGNWNDFQTQKSSVPGRTPEIPLYPVDIQQGWPVTLEF